MALLQFKRPKSGSHSSASWAGVLAGYSIEVMPRTAEKVADFTELLPQGTRVYIAHIDGTPIEDMVATAARLSRDGFDVMPHFPARSIPDAATLENWIGQYQDAAGITQGLVLAGGRADPVGTFADSMQLLDTGLFEKAGFTHLHIAGHPEGNRDIDPDGGTTATDAALAWKQAYAQQTGVQMAIATQFAFETQAMTDWAERIQSNGITLPIHMGIAGPAKLQTLIKFAIACGVGPSLGVLQKRALDVTKLVLPYTPDAVLKDLDTYKSNNPNSLIEKVHVFPLGGIKTSAEWISAQTQDMKATSAQGGSISGS